MRMMREIWITLGVMWLVVFIHRFVESSNDAAGGRPHLFGVGMRGRKDTIAVFREGLAEGFLTHLMLLIGTDVDESPSACFGHFLEVYNIVDSCCSKRYDDQHGRPRGEERATTSSSPSTAASTEPLILCWRLRAGLLLSYLSGTTEDLIFELFAELIIR